MTQGAFVYEGTAGRVVFGDGHDFYGRRGG